MNGLYLGLGQILLGARFFENIAWGYNFQNHIFLGRPILMTFVSGLAWGGFSVANAMSSKCHAEFDMTLRIIYTQ